MSLLEFSRPTNLTLAGLFDCVSWASCLVTLGLNSVDRQVDLGGGAGPKVVTFYRSSSSQPFIDSSLMITELWTTVPQMLQTLYLKVIDTINSLHIIFARTCHCYQG